MEKNGNLKIEDMESTQVKAMVYKKAKGAITVEYGQQGNDALLQIHLPYPERWKDAGNKRLYKQLMRIVDKHMSPRIKIHYMPPNDTMKYLLTIRAVKAFASLGFSEHKLKDLANELAKCKLFLATK